MQEGTPSTDRIQPKHEALQAAEPEIGETTCDVIERDASLNGNQSMPLWTIHARHNLRQSPAEAPCRESAEPGNEARPCMGALEQIMDRLNDILAATPRASRSSSSTR